jgi:hypothetical protein
MGPIVTANHDIGDTHVKGRKWFFDDDTNDKTNQYTNKKNNQGGFGLLSFGSLTVFFFEKTGYGKQ